MQRFFIDSVTLGDNIFILEDKNIIHQLIKVLRVELNEKIALFDGKNQIDFIYEIKEISKKSLRLELIQKLEKNSEINFSLNLYQALPNKISKLEYIVQKATEIGFSSIIFFKSERSQKLIISENKINRLKKIVVEATEQSQRNIIASLVFLKSINPEKIKGENIFFHTKNNKSIDIKKLKIKNKKTINLFVGPEGGWSDNEIKNFEKNIFFKVFLGERVLRTETVGTVVGFWVINN